MTSIEKVRSEDVNMGQAIRIMRKRRNMSQEKLAAGLGLTFQQVQKYEKGTNRVSFSKLCDICVVLQCHPMDLISMADERWRDESTTRFIAAEVDESKRIIAMRNAISVLKEAL